MLRKTSATTLLAFASASLIGCASATETNLGPTGPADAVHEGATALAVCDANRPMGTTPIVVGAFAPGLSFPTATFPTATLPTATAPVDLRAACGRALFVVTLDESCAVCRQFVQHDAADLLGAWQQSNRDARLAIVLTRVANGLGGTRSARMSDIEVIRARYNLPASVEIAVDENAQMGSLGYIGPKLGILLDSSNRVAAFGPSIDLNDVLATQ